MKHSPDFYSGGYLVEVVGCGNDLTLKFKESKRFALAVWHEHIQPVVVFVYNSKLQEWWLVHFGQFADVWDDLAATAGVQEFSSDGNRYVPIAVEDVADAAYMSGKVIPDDPKEK